MQPKPTTASRTKSTDWNWTWAIRWSFYRKQPTGTTDIIEGKSIEEGSAINAGCLIAVLVGVSH